MYKNFDQNFRYIICRTEKGGHTIIIALYHYYHQSKFIPVHLSVIHVYYNIQCCIYCGG